MSVKEAIKKKVINGVEFNSVVGKTEKESRSKILEKKAVIVSAERLSFMSTISAIFFLFLLIEKEVKSILFSINLIKLESKKAFVQNR